MKKYSIGIDIGGTNTQTALVSESGEVLEKKVIKTKDYPNYTDYIDTLCEIINQYKESQKDIIGIGIGAPNANYYSGIIENAPNLIWKEDLYIAKDLQEKVNLKTKVTNDANAATVGEKIYGGAKDLSDFIMITLGTGLGSGFYVNNKLVYGFTGSAGELGHIIIEPNGRTCGCKKKGCLEAYCSASGLVKTYQEISYSVEANLTAADIYSKAKAGNISAAIAFDKFTDKLAVGVSNAILITSPEAVFIFGGLANAEEFVIEPLKEKVNSLLLANFRNKTKILKSSLPESDAAILGAASLVFEL